MLTHLNQIRRSWGDDIVLQKDKKWNLSTLDSGDYKILQNRLKLMCRSYAEIYKYPTLKDSLVEDIKNFSLKLTKNGTPILLIYGIGSDSLAIRHNSFENEINLKFIGCNGDYILPKSEVINSRFPNTGRRLRLTGNYNYYPNPHHKSLNSIYKNIAFQKFNEATIAALEKKYNFKVVDKVLNRELDWF